MHEKPMDNRAERSCLGVRGAMAVFMGVPSP